MGKECKRHKWRVGSSNAKIVDKKIVKDTLNIWCENCDKKIKAKYEPHWKIKVPKEVTFKTKDGRKVTFKSRR